MKTEIKEVGEYKLEITNPEWTCTLTDGDGVREVKMGIVAEFLNREDYDSDIDEDEDEDEDEDDQYKYTVAFSLSPMPESLDKAGKKELLKYVGKNKDKTIYLSDLHEYGASVPLNIDSCSAANENWTGIDYKQNGSNYNFASWDDLDLFIRKIAISRLEGIMLMVGFTLDLNVNRIGTTGWEIIESAVYGTNFVETTLSRKAKKLEEIEAD